MTARLQFSGASRLNVEMPTLDELESDQGDDTCESEGDDYEAGATPDWAWDSPMAVFAWPAWTEPRCAVCCDAPWHSAEACAAAMTRLGVPYRTERPYIEELSGWEPPARVNHTDRLNEYLGAAKRLKPCAIVERVFTTKPEGKPKLTIEQAHEIRRRCAAGEVRSALALEFGVSYTTIAHVMLGKRYK